MGVFDKIGNVVDGASRSINEKTKNMSDTSNLKRKILYEEERILEIFQEIGKVYYKTPDNIEELKLLVDDIDTRKRRIKKMRFELQTKNGFKICPNCQSEVQEKFMFCGVCGAKLPTGDEDFD
ncbi:MAG: zinc ribbon domain-containing protein [Oscillospiraceae bacterium]|nr:zinc ribbon domain-containing protein [Oscillospiraceae bacterium]